MSIVLGVRCPGDAVLHTIAPLGMGAAAGHCLVVDLDPWSPPLPGERSLAVLVEDGPRRSDLDVARRGVAVLPNGGVDWETAAPLVTELCSRWERVVVRVPPRWDDSPWPVVPVELLVPEFPAPSGPAVFQALLRGTPRPGPGVLLPPVSRAIIRSILRGRVEPRWGWVRAWRPVWEAPWG